MGGSEQYWRLFTWILYLHLMVSHHILVECVWKYGPGVSWGKDCVWRVFFSGAARCWMGEAIRSLLEGFSLNSECSGVENWLGWGRSEAALEHCRIGGGKQSGHHLAPKPLKGLPRLRWRLRGTEIETDLWVTARSGVAWQFMIRKVWSSS